MLALAVAFGPGSHPGTSQRAAVLGCATGIAWGFIAAVIKELSSHLGDGLGAIYSTWSLYVLIAAGAATMLLASHALAAGPLAASQPGFTILDPLAASLLGVFLFGEHIRTNVLDLAAEALALALVIAGAAALSRSGLITGENRHPSREHQPTASSAANSPPATPRRPLRRTNPKLTAAEPCRPRALSRDPAIPADGPSPDPALVTAARAGPPQPGRVDHDRESEPAAA